jgi:hypothetical protein
MATRRIPLCILILALAFLLESTHANVQSLKVGLKGGLLYLVSTESASRGEDVYLTDKGGFGFGPWEPWVGLEIRYKPPRGLVTFVADGSYSWMKGSGSFDWVSSSGNGSGGSEFHGDLFIVSGGMQADLLSGPIRPYLGVRLLWTHLNDIQRASANSYDLAHWGFNSFGVGLLAGATIDLSASLAIDASTRYNFTEVDRARSYNPYFNGLFISTGLLFEVL